MALEVKKKKNLKEIVEKLREKGINAQVCKRPDFKCWGSYKCPSNS